MVKNGADIEARDNEGDTPVISAARANRLGVIKVLVAAGASLEATGKDDRSALQIAMAGCYTEVLTPFVAQGQGAEIKRVGDVRNINNTL